MEEGDALSMSMSFSRSLRSMVCTGMPVARDTTFAMSEDVTASPSIRPSISWE
jgi:hypothetical protein